jgi:hypothetical protein
MALSCNTVENDEQASLIEENTLLEISKSVLNWVCLTSSTGWNLFNKVTTFTQIFVMDMWISSTYSDIVLAQIDLFYYLWPKSIQIVKAVSDGFKIPQMLHGSNKVREGFWNRVYYSCAGLSGYPARLGRALPQQMTSIAILPCQTWSFDLSHVRILGRGVIHDE